MSKQVGNAVTRNRVKRRLRHLARTRIERPGEPAVHVVVRALPPAASQPARLADDLDTAWDAALAKLAGTRTLGDVRAKDQRA